MKESMIKILKKIDFTLIGVVISGSIFGFIARP